MLDQDADEALERAEERAVHHRRPVLGVVVAGVDHVEPLGHLVVELDRAHLPRPADRVGHVQVDLGAVEGAVALVQLVLHARPRERARERRLGPVPQGVVADPVVGPGRELEPHGRSKMP